MTRSILLFSLCLCLLGTASGEPPRLALFDRLPVESPAPPVATDAAPKLPLFDAIPVQEAAPTIPDLFGTMPPTAKAAKDDRPVIYVWTGDPRTCTPCRRLEKDRGEIEKLFRLVDGRKQFPKHAVSGTPTFWIYAGGKWHHLSGYDTRDKFVAAVERVLKPAKASASKAVGYPLRGSWWTSPARTREELIAHLLSGQHAGKFPRPLLQRLTWEELQALHSDDHEGHVQIAFTTESY